MMTRVGNQVQPGNYDQILHATEQDQHQAANPMMQNQNPYQQPQQQQPQQPQYQPQQYGQPPMQQQSMMQQPMMQPNYDPNVQFQPGGQPQANFENMPPFGGTPGTISCFETGPSQTGMGQSAVGPQMQTQMQMQPQESFSTPVYASNQQTPSTAQLWVKYRDVLLVVAVVYLVVKFGLPQARRFLPTMFLNVDSSILATALVATSAGAGFYAGKRVLP